MNPHLVLALRLIHLLSMAVWFVAPMSITSDLKKTIARGKPHTDALVGRVERSLNIALVGAGLTIVSGLGLIFATGGFKVVSKLIHAGFGLALVVLSIEFFVVKGGIGRLEGALKGDDSRDAQAAVAKVAMVTGIVHALKLAIMAMMVWRGVA
jgi:hypothetical protein